jgi:hypothetical protein
MRSEEHETRRGSPRSMGGCVRARRRACWVLGKIIGQDDEGAPIYQYFMGAGEHGRLRTSMFRADGYKFSSQTSALECAGTHLELAHSSEWWVLPIVDRFPPKGMIGPEEQQLGRTL